MRKLLLIVGLLTGMLSSACAVKHKPMRIENSVSIADLDAQTQIAEDLVLYFDSKPSTGRFPAGIAIVRLARQWNEPHNRYDLKIQPFLPYEAPFWMELFDGTPEIRSVFFLHEKSVRSPTVTIPDLLHAAESSNAGLLLVYGYDNSSTARACQVTGVLHEVADRTRLAAISHTATLEDAWAASTELPMEHRPVTPADWDFYVDYTAFREFEQKFQTCIWHLIDRDRSNDELKHNPYADFRPRYSVDALSSD